MVARLPRPPQRRPQVVMLAFEHIQPGRVAGFEDLRTGAFGQSEEEPGVAASAWLSPRRSLPAAPARTRAPSPASGSAARPQRPPPAAAGSCRPARPCPRRHRACRLDSTTASAASMVQPPAKTASRRNSACSSGVEEIVAPGDGIAHRLLPGRQGPRPSRQQRQALLQALEQRLRWQHLDEGGGQFNGQRQPIEARADLGHGRGVGSGHREVGFHRLRPLDEEAHRLVLAQGLHRRQVGQDPAAEAAGADTRARRRRASGVRLVASTFTPGARASRSATTEAASTTRSKLSRTSSSRFPPSTLARRVREPAPLLPHAEDRWRSRRRRGPDRRAHSDRRTRRRPESPPADRRRPARPGASCRRHRDR